MCFNYFSALKLANRAKPMPTICSSKIKHFKQEKYDINPPKNPNLKIFHTNFQHQKNCHIINVSNSGYLMFTPMLGCVYITTNAFLHSLQVRLS